MYHYGFFAHAKINIMAHINTYKLKVAFRIYGKHYNLLTSDERSHVNQLVYDNY